MSRFARITILALAALLVAGTAFAAETQKAVTGTVVSYTAADATGNTPATLVVTVKGKSESFVLDAKSVITGKDKKAADVAALKAGVKVKVTFTEDAKKVMTVVSVVLE